MLFIQHISVCETMKFLLFCVYSYIIVIYNVRQLTPDNIILSQRNHL